MSRYIVFPFNRHTTVMFAALYVLHIFVFNIFFKNFSIIYSCLVSTQSKMYAHVKNL